MMRCDVGARFHRSLILSLVLCRVACTVGAPSTAMHSCHTIADLGSFLQGSLHADRAGLLTTDLGTSAMYPNSKPQGAIVDERPTRERRGKRRLSVAIQELLPIGIKSSALTSVKSFGFNMLSLYGRSICAGAYGGGFVTDAHDAPADFCAEVDRRPDILMLLACAECDQYGASRAKFSQYALERVMLGKWMTSSFACEASQAGCRERADVVVVPSIFFHMQAAQSFQMVEADWECWDKAGGLNLCWDKYHEEYWTQVRNMYYKPNEGYTPLIVVHCSFVFDVQAQQNFLRALSKQPFGFAKRVVVAAIERNLRKTALQVLPYDWFHGSLEDELERREHGKPSGPLLVPMPYPLPIHRAVSFSASSGKYNHTKPRRIIASIFGHNKGIGREGGNWIRNQLFTSLSMRGQEIPGGPPGSKVTSMGVAACASGNETLCGLRVQQLNMWDIAVSSTFCVQPAGDSMTRSQLYVSVLAGCIPVIFDGGHELYDTSEPTWWAWRSNSTSPSPPFTRYDSFALVYSAADAFKPDFWESLFELPSKNRKRFARLRAALDEAAPRMRYSLDTYKEGDDAASDAHQDAFAALVQLVRRVV
eukprot:TRINITY_DN7667_c0_g1_i6.p1 TRINITY_DN7667_c0_g1~~TRINITY_DN7667_c0_g1_i6.p1  ORF type:complete len:591 (-),score=62.23 TRINITY_DN7667_c0_g1_i6:422-2194(-)